MVHEHAFERRCDTRTNPRLGTRTQTLAYTGWLESGGGRRESHSINTPRCLLRLHPQERRSTPVASRTPLAYQPASPLSLLLLDVLFAPTL